jgi:hypothetical protein
VVITPSFLSAGSSDSAAGAATTIGAQESGEATGDDVQSESLAQSLDQVSIAAVPRDTATLDAPAGTESAGVERVEGYFLPRLGDVDLDKAASRYSTDGEFASTASGDEIDGVLVSKCVSRYGDEGFVTSEPLATGLIDGQEILLIAYTAADGSVTIVAHDLTNCTVVDLADTTDSVDE